MSKNNIKKTTLFIICGPTASGKTTLVNRLVKEMGLRRAISATTRDPRPGECGEDYNFMDLHRFNHSKFVECDVYGGHRYGTLQSECNVSDIVILTHSGVVKVMKYCKKIGRPCFVIGMIVRRKSQLERLTQRGDSAKSIYVRLEDDESMERVFGNALYDAIVPEMSIDETYTYVRDIILQQLSKCKEG